MAGKETSVYHENPDMIRPMTALGRTFVAAPAVEWGHLVFSLELFSGYFLSS